jgi:hypothetical protein
MTRRAVLEHTKIHYSLGAGTDHSLIIIAARVPGKGRAGFPRDECVTNSASAPVGFHRVAQLP